MKKLLATLAVLLALVLPARATTIHGCPWANFYINLPSNNDGIPLAVFGWAKDAAWPFNVSGLYSIQDALNPVTGSYYAITETHCATGGGGAGYGTAGGLVCGGFAYTPQGGSVQFGGDHYWDGSGNYYNAPYNTCRDDVGGPQPSWTQDYSWGLQMTDANTTSYTGSDTFLYNMVRLYDGPTALSIQQANDLCIREIDFDVNYATANDDDHHVMIPIVNPAGYFADIPSACRIASFVCTPFSPGYPNPNYLHCALVFGDITQGGGGPCCRS